MEEPETIERKETHLGRLVASAASIPDSGYCSSMSAVGAGTTADPLRIALLVRTVDWADEETTPETSRSNTARVHAALEGALATSTAPEALRAAQAVAASTQDFFSGCAAVVAGRQVRIAAIGYVRAWRLRGGRYDVLIEPNIRPANPSPGASVGMLASLGSIESLDQARLAEVVLEPSDLVLITMGGELEEMPEARPSEAITPEVLLGRTRPIGMSPAILVVVGGDPDASS
ncbi:hypothetical protein [Polyangium fumosum]|uniref:Uncharacterized protein n=1 Tax=Polyangium fumosum TaxID=889272 RepID=A0A4U1J6I8_9BACT|nr:hypothetical protein [Polyangium fumosum]TKD02732.1 hypothetical protein E8A74_27925 [Polyangium fumosum]